jgi:hypothetical protein
VARYGGMNRDEAAVTRGWRFTEQCGDVELEHGGIVGNTRELLQRMRWIF